MRCCRMIPALILLAGCSAEPANVTSRTGPAEVRERPVANSNMPDAQRPNTPAR
ncbi:hypothetical protein [uncultured Sphingomonas sp.]|uniref:hypothetical protein n=1 Tax=uncultured Sphingomonas sp. TaxID=158754 RepID=UPI00261611C9|nr:hypothetical protein [uncultured Sphingomonas sp.]